MTAPSTARSTCAPAGAVAECTRAPAAGSRSSSAGRAARAVDCGRTFWRSSELGAENLAFSVGGEIIGCHPEIYVDVILGFNAAFFIGLICRDCPLLPA